MTVLRTCGLVFASLLLASPLAAVTLGQMDTFEDGTTMGWYVPGFSPNPPANEPNGGPAGSGDAYLRLTAAGGLGPGSKLSALNEAQWSGDYLASGVTSIRMDVNNFGPSDLHLRLLFEDIDMPGPPVNLALSAQAVFVPAGSGWVTVEFPVTSAFLVAETGNTLDALSSTDTFRIFHNPDPTFPGPPGGIPGVAVTLGVDNILATVPEPHGVVPLLSVLSALFLRRYKGDGCDRRSRP